MKARQLFWQTSKETTQAARQLLEEAIKIDAQDVRSWGLLAMTHLNDAWNQWSESTDESLALADNASIQAIKVDELDPWAHHTRSAVTGTLGDLSQAEADLKRALVLNPHFAAALGDMTRVRVFAGKTEGAVIFAQNAIKASPRDPHISLWHYWIALSYFVDGNYQSGLPHLEEALAIRPDWLILNRLKVVSLALGGDVERARDTLLSMSDPSESDFLRVLEVKHPFSSPEPLQRYRQGLSLASAASIRAVR